MHKLLVALLMTVSVAAHADMFAVAPTDLGGWIILEDYYCQAPLQAWHHFSVTRADGMVVSSGCWYLSDDRSKIVAREGTTLYPISWPAEIFHMVKK